MERDMFNFNIRDDCVDGNDNEEKYGDTILDPQEVEEKYRDCKVDPQEVEDKYGDTLVDPQDIEKKFKFNIKTEPVDFSDPILVNKKGFDIKQDFEKELKATLCQTISQNQKQGPSVMSQKKGKKNNKTGKKVKNVPCLFCFRKLKNKHDLSSHMKSTGTSFNIPHPLEAEMVEAKMRGFYKCDICNSRLSLKIGGVKMNKHLTKCKSEQPQPNVDNNFLRLHNSRHKFTMSEQPQPLMERNVSLFPVWNQALTFPHLRLQGPLHRQSYPFQRPPFPPPPAPYHRQPHIFQRPFFLPPPAPFQQFPVNFLNVRGQQFSSSYPLPTVPNPMFAAHHQRFSHQSMTYPWRYGYPWRW